MKITIYSRALRNKERKAKNYLLVSIWDRNITFDWCGLSFMCGQKGYKDRYLVANYHFLIVGRQNSLLSQNPFTFLWLLMEWLSSQTPCQLYVIDLNVFVKFCVGTKRNGSFVSRLLDEWSHLYNILNASFSISFSFLPNLFDYSKFRTKKQLKLWGIC